MPKYAFTFQKTETVRWLGHLDILRTFERAIRRAELPIAFSSGFNPRERISFASALSTGVTGAAEPAILELTDSMAPIDVEERLNAALPPAIRIARCEEIPDLRSRDFLNAFDRADYEVVCACPVGIRDADIVAAIDSLLSRAEIPVTREREGRTKTVDIRPFLYCLSPGAERPTQDRITLHMQVAVGEQGNAKPAEVVAALEPAVPGLTLRRAHRVQLHKSS